MTRAHHVPAGAPPRTVAITPETANWTYSGLQVLALRPGESHDVRVPGHELLVVPLSGGCTVSGDAFEFSLAGRQNVFAGPTDFAYVPTGSAIRISTARGGRFALPSALAGRALPPRYGPADAVPVELRGAGRASRQVHNFCTPETFDADRLIAVEVLTPGGNWSSYPPHKHDEHTEHERALEEIYYFEIGGHDGEPGVGYQRVYTSGAGREIDVLAEVRTGDTVLIPYGYHGPSMAAPGYDMYYLNVMAGPAERLWRFTDDPAHAWIRDTWRDERIDPRLPFRGGARESRTSE
jgi:5-deoxy-glucuronate isomerase